MRASRCAEMRFGGTANTSRTTTREWTKPTPSTATSTTWRSQEIIDLNRLSLPNPGGFYLEITDRESWVGTNLQANAIYTQRCPKFCDLCNGPLSGFSLWQHDRRIKAACQSCTDNLLQTRELIPIIYHPWPRPGEVDLSNPQTYLARYQEWLRAKYYYYSPARIIELAMYAATAAIRV